MTRWTRIELFVDLDNAGAVAGVDMDERHDDMNRYHGNDCMRTALCRYCTHSHLLHRILGTFLSLQSLILMISIRHS